MERADVAEALEELAGSLELAGANPFKARAYAQAARAVRTFAGDWAAVARAGRWTDVPGLAGSPAQAAAELAATGQCALGREMAEALPAPLRALAGLGGVGPKKLAALRAAGIASPDDLAGALADGQLAALAGFGGKTAAKLAEELERWRAARQTALSDRARALAADLLERLRGRAGVERAEAAGEVRRALPVVRTLAFVAAGPPDALAAAAGALGLAPAGPEAWAARPDEGPAVRLRAAPADAFGTVWLEESAAPAHLEALRARRGGPLPHLTDETAVYAAAGLPWIDPLWREGGTELARAQAGNLPAPWDGAALTGVFHNHTFASDGYHSLREMAGAAAALGFAYLGIADHSVSSVQADGLDERRLRAQITEIRRLNASGTLPCRLLAGSEVDILPDGSLDYPDALLYELDYVVASVHSSFTQSREEMTARICRALAHPAVTMLGHATGRLLNRRPGYALDLAQVCETAARHGKVIEFNANPHRLDLGWEHWETALAAGVQTSVNPDAHHVRELAYARPAADLLRKGFAGAGDVWNTRPWAELAERVARQRGDSAGGGR